MQGDKLLCRQTASPLAEANGNDVVCLPIGSYISKAYIDIKTHACSPLAEANGNDVVCRMSQACTILKTSLPSHLWDGSSIYESGFSQNHSQTKKPPTYSKRLSILLKHVNYLLLPPNMRSNKRNRLIKSRYRVKAPIMAVFLPSALPYSIPAPMRFSFCTS